METRNEGGIGFGTTRGRRALAALGLLLAATLGAGAALRGVGGATNAGASPATPGNARFAAPAGGPVRLSAELDRTAVLVGGDRQVRLELAIGAEAGDSGTARAPADVVVVLDRSGSMDGEKIVFARSALLALQGALRPEDRIALVSYSDDARLELPLGTAEALGGAWARIVAGIQPGGGTNLAAGLDLGLELLRASHGTGRVQRLVLVSDGLANVGDHSPEGLRARAARAAAAEWALSTVGVGLDFDEALLSTLADAGTGNFYFLESASGLDHLFDAEFSLARETTATGLELALAPAPGVEVLEVAGYPLERDAAGRVRIRAGSLFAGQERRLWVTLRLPPAAAGESTSIGRVSLGYTRGGSRGEVALTEEPRVAFVADPERMLGSMRPAAWARSVAVEDVNTLRREAAGAIREGRQDEMVAKIKQYQADTAAINARLRIDTVGEQLRSLDDLAKDLQASAAAPAAAQSRAAKKLEAEAKASARPGTTVAAPGVR